jgi:hypothetical protein
MTGTRDGRYSVPRETFASVPELFGVSFTASGIPIFHVSYLRLPGNPFVFGDKQKK